MKKKFVTMLLATTLAISAIACGGNDSGDSNNTGNESGNDVENPKENEENPDSNNDSNTGTNDEEDKDNQNNEDSQKPEAFEGITVVDNEYCVIKITDYQNDSIWGNTLKVFLENKSSDKTFMYSVNNASVNGVQIQSIFASEVAAGKKENTEIVFSDDDFKQSGIDKFTDIALTFRVYDTNDWVSDDVAQETVHVYPYGKENATTFTRQAQPSDNVLIDNEYVTAIVTGYEEDEIWGYTVNWFFVNKTDSSAMFSTDEVSVNGYMADPFFATSVAPKTCAFASMSWIDDSFEENLITDVTDISFILKAYNDDNWDGNNYAEQSVTLNP